MISHLITEHGLAREDAYILCSVAGQLRMHEVASSLSYEGQLTLIRLQVDMPNYVIGLMMPQSIFGHSSAQI